MDNETQQIIAHNEEVWNRLVRVLSNPEERSVLWVNCDTDYIRKPLRDAINGRFPEFPPRDIYVDEQTLSLNDILFAEGEHKIPEGSLIHVHGMSKAATSEPFLAQLNFGRDRLFRQAPGNIIFWADFGTGSIIASRAYDFWSWMSQIFDFVTPDEFLTARQRDFPTIIRFEDREIPIPEKNAPDRIRHLEEEWDKFMKAVKGKPFGLKQVDEAVVLARGLAVEYRGAGEYWRIVNLMEPLLSTLNDQNDDHKIDIWSKLSIAFRYLGKLNKSEEYGELAFRAAEEKFGAKDPRTSTLQSNLALIYMDMAKLDKARDLLEQALKMDIQKLGEQHPNVASSQSNLATVYYELGDLNKANDLLKQSLRSDIDNFGEHHPNVAIRRSNLALVYQELGKLDKARDLLEQSLKNGILNYGDHHPDVAIRQSNLSTVYFNLGELDKAKYLIEEAIKTDILNFGEHHPSVAVRQSNLALVYKHLGEFEKAKDLLEQALKNDIINFGENHPSVATHHNNLAFVLDAMLQSNEAQMHMAKAYNIARHVWGEEHKNTRLAKQWLDARAAK